MKFTFLILCAVLTGCASRSFGPGSKTPDVYGMTYDQYQLQARQLYAEGKRDQGFALLSHAGALAERERDRELMEDSINAQRGAAMSYALTNAANNLNAQQMQQSANQTALRTAYINSNRRVQVDANVKVDANVYNHYPSY